MAEFDPALVEKAERALFALSRQAQAGAPFESRPHYIRRCLRDEAIAVLSAVGPEIYQQALTDALHPEFGTAWREPDGEGYKARQQGRVDGARQALRDAAEDFRQAEGDGYLFLGDLTERVPWEAVAQRLDALAAGWEDEK